MKTKEVYPWAAFQKYERPDDPFDKDPSSYIVETAAVQDDGTFVKRTLVLISQFSQHCLFWIVEEKRFAVFVVLKDGRLYEYRIRKLK